MKINSELIECQYSSFNLMISYKICILNDLFWWWNMINTLLSFERDVRFHLLQIFEIGRLIAYEAEDDYCV